MQYIITEIENNKVEKPTLQNICKLIYEYNKECYPEENMSLESIEKDFLRENQLELSHKWIIQNKDRPNFVLGYGYLNFHKKNSPNYEETKNVASFNIIITKDHRRNKLGSRLFALIKEKAELLNKKLLQTQVTISDSKEFCDYHSGIIANKGIENRLQSKDIDWNMIDQWIQEGKLSHPNIKIEQYFELPEKYITIVAQLSNELLADEPTGDNVSTEVITVEHIRDSEKYFREENWELIVLITINSTDVISGVTLCAFDKNNPKIVNQYLTGIKKIFRGKGLGKWLKAEMLHRLKTINPNFQEIITGNRTTNDVMLAINKKLGFRPYRTIYYYSFAI
ncbi:MAG: hypothetical protein ACFFD1_06055 [Candidatus Thorarchaeota archaeon]